MTVLYEHPKLLLAQISLSCSPDLFFPARLTLGFILLSFLPILFAFLLLLLLSLLNRCATAAFCSSASLLEAVRGVPLLQPTTAASRGSLARVVALLERQARGPAGHRAGHGRHSVHELGPEDHVGVGEHALLQGDDQELRTRKMRPQHVSDVLGVREVERGVHLVEDVHRGRLEQEKRKDEG